MKEINVTVYNQKAWDKQVEAGENEWTIPVTHEEIEMACKGQVSIYLTPTKTVPISWFPVLDHCKVLCLASGGGQQGPILAAAGAVVTVFDNSPRQLQSDEMVARREGLEIRTVQGDMKDLSVFEDGSFDLIVHPVSNIFVPEILPVWQEAARVLKKGGILLAGITNPVLFLFDEQELSRNRLVVAHKIPYSPFNEDARAETERFLESGGVMEFGHTLQDQLGGQLEAGFVITGLYEDRNRENVKNPLDQYISTFMATRAVKMS